MGRKTGKTLFLKHLKEEELKQRLFRGFTLDAYIRELRYEIVKSLIGTTPALALEYHDIVEEQYMENYYLEIAKKMLDEKERWERAW